MQVIKTIFLLFIIVYTIHLFFSIFDTKLIKLDNKYNNNEDDNVNKKNEESNPITVMNVHHYDEVHDHSQIPTYTSLAIAIPTFTKNLDVTFLENFLANVVPKLTEGCNFHIKSFVFVDTCNSNAEFPSQILQAQIVLRKNVCISKKIDTALQIVFINKYLQKENFTLIHLLETDNYVKKSSKQKNVCYYTNIIEFDLLSIFIVGGSILQNSVISSDRINMHINGNMIINTNFFLWSQLMEHLEINANNNPQFNWDGEIYEWLRKKDSWILSYYYLRSRTICNIVCDENDVFPFCVVIHSSFGQCKNQDDIIPYSHNFVVPVLTIETNNNKQKEEILDKTHTLKNNNNNNSRNVIIYNFDDDSICNPFTENNYTWVSYLRVQKTGSKTFIGILSRKFKLDSKFCVSIVPRSTCSYEHIDDCAIINKELVNSRYYNHKIKKAIFTPHSDYDDLVHAFDDIKDFDDSNVHFIGLIRNPITRVISEYKHAYAPHPKCMWDYPVVVEEPICKKTFLNWLRNDINIIGASNRQTRMYAGYRYIDCNDTQMFERAIKNLKSFKFVGITDDFLRTGAMLSHFLGIDNILPIRNLEKNDGKEFFNIDEEIKNEILKYNQLDAKLYEIVKKEYNQLLKKCQDKILK